LTTQGSRARRHREVAATLAILAACAVAVLSGVIAKRFDPAGVDEDRAGRCEALLDRYAELRVRAAAAKAPPPADIERAQLKARDLALANQALERCADELTETHAACASKANNVDELERCFP
jgi:hypothetical protein